MDVKNTIKNLFQEQYKGGSNRKDLSHAENRDSDLYRSHDAERKREERAAEKRLKLMKKENDESIDLIGKPKHHPRDFLNKSPLKLTLKETFLKHIVDYIETNKKSHIKEAVQLMEEYPKLKEFVTSESRKPFSSLFNVYHIKEHLHENEGETIELSDSLRAWHISKSDIEHRHPEFDNHMILEAKISPDKILLYLPAFSKLVEELIFSGKIEECQTNVLRKIKQHNELILHPSVNQGVITEIHKGII